MTRTFLSLLIVLFSAFGMATTPSRIAVYGGTGTCDGCAEDIRDELRNAGYVVEILNQENVTLENLKKFDLYIQPGGDDVGAVKNALRQSGATGIHGLEALQKYVEDGGNFLGICLGGFLADSTLEDDHTENLHLIAAAAKPHSKNPKARLENINWSGVDHNLDGKMKIYFQDGPEFRTLSPEPKQGHPVVLAIYNSNESVAAIMNTYGAGHAMALGVHPEATDEWFRLDHLKNDKTSVQKGNQVFLKLVEKLMGH